MQITSINKTITMIFVGLSVVLVFNIHFDGAVASQKVTQVSGMFGSGSIVLLLALAVFFGMVIDALTSLVLAPLKRSLTKSRADTPSMSHKVAMFLFQSYSLKRLHNWSQIFQDLKISNTNMLDGKYSEIDDLAEDTASAYFHNMARKEQFEWAASHYSTYLLASNMAFIATLSLMLGVLLGSMSWVAAMAHLLVIYCLCVLALGRYIYTYTYTYRSIVVLRELAEQAAD